MTTKLTLYLKWICDCVGQDYEVFFYSHSYFLKGVYSSRHTVGWVGWLVCVVVCGADYSDRLFWNLMYIHDQHEVYSAWDSFFCTIGYHSAQVCAFGPTGVLHGVYTHFQWMAMIDTWYPAYMYSESFFFIKFYIQTSSYGKSTVWWLCEYGLQMTSCC